ncbi:MULTISPECIES: hypothetical protein [Edwardsiella]|uniref:Lipoprotein n=2 Tax=Edwardsiella anguillarum TaxID=1821960 RepID=A0A076LMI0_9GAMM|nr:MULTISPECIES: hypothetical protein [Edwardsiella]AKM46640.1 hypothetical protein QY76_04160 [Edwardsiella sp. EA181011]GAJ67663.1 hypothetical protein MA13_contig00006-0189 [Edwardsiella piscicida]AIJ07942.1 Hypothetical protein ETEE_1491 [Edwardsiella anguillarum ET080813]AKR79038.1 hypothetical protein AAZ33_17045 [Edwardsiella sp. LADL05-105]KAB0591792.1 hypothetical protein F7P84_07745 [Edwardsiella anguillarum]
MRAKGVGWGTLLLACGGDAARDPFQPPELAPAAASAVGIVGRAPCFSLWRRDEQGRWRPAALPASPRPAALGPPALRFTPLALYPFRCPRLIPLAARREGTER